MCPIINFKRESNTNNYSFGLSTPTKEYSCPAVCECVSL